MNDKYGPPAGLSLYELNVIGQSLMTDLGQQVRQLSAMAPDMLKYCAEHGIDPQQVLEREIGYLANRYEVVCRFVVMPFPWEMFESLAREGWTS